MCRAIALLEGSQASPACPFDQNSIKMKISVQHWWNGAEGENRRTERETSPITTLSPQIPHGLIRDRI